MANTFPFKIAIGAVDKLTGPLARMEGGIARFGRSTQRLGRQLSLAVSAPIIAAGTATILTGAGFEAQLNRVRALTSATTEQMAALETEARALGSTTRFSATQAAEAMANYSLAGFEVGETLAVTRGTLDLAAAADIELAQAAEITATTLRTQARDLARYGDTADQTARVVDVLTTGFTRSLNTLENLGEAFVAVGDVAAESGFAFETTAAALEVLGNKGKRGAEAGTALRAIIARLAKPTPEATRMFEALGIALSDLQGPGGVLDLVKTVRLLEESLGDLTPVQRQSALATIFGVRQFAAVNSLVSAGAGELERYIELNGEVGIAARKAAVMMEGTKGAWLELKSATEELLLRVGREGGLLEQVEELLDALTRLVTKVAQMDPRLLRLATIFGTLAAAVGPALIAIGLMAQGLNGILVVSAKLWPWISKLAIAITTQLIPAIWASTAALLANPIFQITATIFAVAAALALLVYYWDEVTAAIERASAAVRDNVKWLSIFHGPRVLAAAAADRISLEDVLGAFAAGGARGRPALQEDVRAAAAAAAPARDAHVRVDLEGLPRGTRVEKTGDAPLELNLGYALEGT